MVIRHSMKILEQLSEIENLIKEFEEYLDSNGVEVDREKMLLKLIRSRETQKASRKNKN